MKTLVLVLLLVVGWGRAADQPARAMIDDFLAFHCLDCHDSASEKAGRNFEAFQVPLQGIPDLITAREILDQVSLGEMPPREKEQPEPDERDRLVRALQQEIAASRDRLAGERRQTVMRRLSNREYENTLEVLFGRRVDTLGLTLDFPKEKTSHHLDTIGESLVTSGFLVDQYFQAAQLLVESRLGKPRLEPREWHFTDNFVQYEELKGSHRSVFQNRFLCLYEQPDTDTRQGSYGHIEDFLEGVPVSGLYELKVLIKAMHRDTHYDPKIFGIDLSEPFRLGVVPGDITAGHIHYPQPIEPRLAEAVVPDEDFTWITFQVWLEAGQTPRFIFPNGPYESRRSVIELNRRYRDEFENPDRGVSRKALLREGKLPHLRISEVKIRGPLPEKGGSMEERTVFGPDGFQAGRAKDQLERFAARAFRRPLHEEDRRRLHQFHDQRLAQGSSARQAALDVLKFILCSPSFFYLSEITPGDDPELSPHDLATRLSYTLWAGPPDARLRSLAAQGDLARPEILRLEIERLLADPRSVGFVKGFLDGWLRLRDLGAMPPPRARARRYYSENWPASMKGEVRHFLTHLLRENRPVRELLDADYTFVDKDLAKHYGLPEGETLRLRDGFRKVSLPDKRRRGGLLAMAALLTVSANGVETSPITRGVYVSETILGKIPPPPPAEVPAIEPDVRGATTLRQRLAQHLDSRSCAECHRKIDPPGFGLEAFDELGRWRSHYRQPHAKAPKLVVDASGKLPSGEEFAGFSELRRVLLSTRFEVFQNHLVATLLAYGTGRHLDAVDQFVIDDIIERVAKKGGGLRTLVTESLASEIFRRR